MYLIIYICSKKEEVEFILNVFIDFQKKNSKFDLTVKKKGQKVTKYKKRQTIQEI